MRELALSRRRFRTMHLFAGAGGGILADLLLGHIPVCAVEIDPYRRDVLLARQRDGLLPRFPVWDDVRSFDGCPWRAYVDVVSGGFPCQGFSVAGRGLGFDDPRSGLWSDMARVVGEVRPGYVFVENVPNLARRGLARVLGDLAALGYDARWCVLGARHVGAPHRRDRLWVLAHLPGDVRHADGILRDDSWDDRPFDAAWEPADERERRDLGNSYCPSKNPHPASSRSWRPTRESGWWLSEPGMGRVVDELAGRVDRIAALGDGQVPLVVAVAWHTLIGLMAPEEGPRGNAQ